MDRKASGKLRDSYIGRIPEEERAISVKFAWHELWSKVLHYLSREELMQLGEALVLAGAAHKEQKRSTGDPYIVHSINVASILAEMQLDAVTLSAALLHDVLEDTDITLEKLRSTFGAEVATLVDGVTKLGKLPFKSFEDYQAENLRKMFIVMAKDIRVVLIKLADRLHNMRTLGVLRKDKQMRIARETLEIYAPLAHRLGIYQVKRGLEDLAFKYADPEMYYEIRRRVRKKLPERETVVKKALEILTSRLEEEGIHCRVKGRAKHFYSIYEKMNRKKLPVEQLYDLLALRVVVDDIAACYTVLGIVHTIWKPIPGQFDDYIANPKSNMYQSLHTTVVGPTGEPLEVQIRTGEMNSLAEYGIAAHWRYKEGGSKLDDLDTKLTWIRQALEADHEEAPDSSEFLERLKDDVLSSEVFVFTPQGEVVSLPKGSTPIDFAYAIHTQVGMRCVGAMVNNRIVAMGYELQNGDIVKIVTSPQGAPSRDWLKIARSSKARSKIRAYFRALEKTERLEKVQRGRELLERELRRRGTPEFESFEEIMPLLNKIARDTGQSNGEDLLSAIGAGHQSVSLIAQRLAGKTQAQAQPATVQPEQEKHTSFAGKKGESDIVVEGAEGVQVVLSNCCEPVPGDPIVGYSTRTRGITVHRADCENVKNAKEERMIAVSWGTTGNRRYPARLKLEGVDRAALFGDVAQAIIAGDGNMTGIKAGVVGGNLARMKIEVRVHDLEHLLLIVAKLNAVKGVINVSRG
ncbi:MAG: bifunctional (p)ppGpp synthetase/guanosine-3',5'-bis(diphosphate) 3'-pyrophosphohydrolase [Synergistaceae bacterium]|uniref:RelA/SpoT family protein n=1 Tax=Aminivibrio sp. TaxID=1872489 RepID=UPI00345E6E53|nr:bifunctional (p)ppGpp synthetase/guanosine-3',5'-bis(diphosphate) 3'-pyrophosphohydrolase [Synergistaceae bacterium]MDD3688738.1 bifunctional (p)ppGpp synthetase/guanosine-3',5'-bis(diphosphate) 3'-pyrophosphohydrolase [Synergistaceae bacterium]MDD4020861.1 bifunctional (p)ppGpp synthetase/guanosine-3',5'-bis(diphosphate) 3'-pyrophosphohydrolase [Synergistaceae bacterium]MDD4611760.1 bifunctional (p)ppGpp synthetase/guanosine-3',5'-bis(diphosphate) 3'-pyrophosphohydrolase [Synergistaceae bact